MINPKIDLIAETFDLITSRANLACQLFKVGQEKLIEEYITDFHLMPRSIRWDRELNGDTIDVFEQFPWNVLVISFDQLAEVVYLVSISMIYRSDLF